MKEITELDTNKYHVMKVADIEKYLSPIRKRQLSLINTEIRYGRIKEGKKEWGDWLVLNLDDEIDSVALYANIQKARWKVAGSPINMKVSDIAVALVNAILKAKEKP